MNTSLIQTKVWLPIYKVESAIHYQSIRKTTAFEALILKLAIQHKEKLGQINLEKICEIFKIEQNFIANALETLIDNDVIERVSGYLEDIKVIHIKVTDLGRDLFYKNQMPSNPKVEAITCHYDPLLLSLVKAKNNWTSHNKDENLTLSKDVFSANLGQIGQLVDYIVQQADEKTFVWKKPNVNISKIENEVERILWRDLPIEIGLDSNANIHLESKGKGEDIA